MIRTVFRNLIQSLVILCLFYFFLFPGCPCQYGFIEDHHSTNEDAVHSQTNPKVVESHHDDSCCHCDLLEAFCEETYRDDSLDPQPATYALKVLDLKHCSVDSGILNRFVPPLTERWSPDIQEFYCIWLT